MNYKLIISELQVNYKWIMTSIHCVTMFNIDICDIKWRKLTYVINEIVLIGVLNYF